MRLPRVHRHARLELLPLMDVVFLILVFLIYAMMVMVVQMGMPVALPTSKSAQPQQVVVLALTIEQNGDLWLDKERVTPENLAAEVMSQSRARGLVEGDEPTVQIFADAALPYQKLFNVLDILKQAGLKKISLQAREGG
ncbi:MAG: biopolymer transporter ExbD [Desulfovibrio sp.]|nr:biopolymer transporter ExbD [Desulfovibrio sp.]